MPAGSDNYKICSRPDCGKCIPEDAYAHREYCSKKCLDKVRNARKVRPADDSTRSREKWQAEKARLAAIKAGRGVS